MAITDMLLSMPMAVLVSLAAGPCHGPATFLPRTFCAGANSIASASSASAVSLPQ